MYKARGFTEKLEYRVNWGSAFTRYWARSGDILVKEGVLGEGAITVVILARPPLLTGKGSCILRRRLGSGLVARGDQL